MPRRRGHPAPTPGCGREVPGVDRRLRRPRRRRLPGISDPLEGRLREPGLEGFRRGAGRHAREPRAGAQGPRRAAGVRLRRLAAHGPGVRCRGQARPRSGPENQGQESLPALQRRLLGRGGRLLRLLPGRREAEDHERRLQSRPLPVVWNSASRTRREGGQAPHGARHVDRLGHPDAFGRQPGLQPQFLPERLRLAA